MPNDLIKQLKLHIKTDKSLKLYPVIKDKDIAAAEKTLGFTLPELLKSIYKEISDGGLALAYYGLRGIKHKEKEDDFTLEEEYREHQKGAAWRDKHDKHQEPGQWQHGLLPFWSWGCAMFTCVDCLDPNLPIYHSEYCKTDQRNFNLHDFFEMWLKGICPMDADAPPKISREILNPFIKQKTTVYGRGKK